MSVQVQMVQKAQAMSPSIKTQQACHTYTFEQRCYAKHFHAAAGCG